MRFKLPRFSRRQKVNAILGGIAWALLGVGLVKTLGGNLHNQVWVAVCDATAGALVWFAFDKPPPAKAAKRTYVHIHNVHVYEEKSKDTQAKARVSRGFLSSKFPFFRFGWKANFKH